MTYRTTGCLVRFCERDGVRTLDTIPLCDTHYGLARKHGIDQLPLIASARRRLEQLGLDEHDCTAKDTRQPDQSLNKLLDSVIDHARHVKLSALADVDDNRLVEAIKALHLIEAMTTELAFTGKVTAVPQ